MNTADRIQAARSIIARKPKPKAAPKSLLAKKPSAARWTVIGTVHQDAPADLRIALDVPAVDLEGLIFQISD